MAKSSETRAGATGAPKATPRRRIRLGSVEEMRKEMERVYREARQNELDIGVASKLSYMLSQMTRVAEVSNIERRLLELERAREKTGA